MKEVPPWGNVVVLGVQRIFLFPLQPWHSHLAGKNASLKKSPETAKIVLKLTGGPELPPIGNGSRPQKWTRINQRQLRGSSCTPFWNPPSSNRVKNLFISFLFGRLACLIAEIPMDLCRCLLLIHLHCIITWLSSDLRWWWATAVTTRPVNSCTEWRMERAINRSQRLRSTSGRVGPCTEYGMVGWLVAVCDRLSRDLWSVIGGCFTFPPLLSSPQFSKRCHTQAGRFCFLEASQTYCLFVQVIKRVHNPLAAIN